ncbi:hypothetical protein Vi05172_g6105 [Venturia inaequalis]|nr:hypothetical protein Vi05172_g6105 [Venturia inaequalis]
MERAYMENGFANSFLTHRDIAGLRTAGFVPTMRTKLR